MSQYLEDLYSLEGRTAVVTGASSGIGRRMAIALSSAGAAVIGVARRAVRLAELAEEIELSDGAVATQCADLAQISDFDSLAEELSQPFGAPDILVNAAGFNPRKHADDVSVQDWQATLHLNLSVPFLLARALVPGMREMGYGRIINLASGQTFRAYANGIAYGAAKGGIGQLTRAMAEAWSPDAIAVNAIQPGFFDTELTATLFSDQTTVERLAEKTAAKRNGEIDHDLDGATVFLASKSARYVTGHILAVDGGLMAV